MFDNNGRHPATCPHDGDDIHIAYEFNKAHPGEDYAAFIKKQTDSGVKYPEMEFNETELVLKDYILHCPVCDYIQDRGASTPKRNKEQ